MAKAKAVALAPDPTPEPNQRDKAAIERASARVLARSKRASIRVTGTEGCNMQVAAPPADASGHQRQMPDAFGTPSHDFMSAAVGGAEPDNEIEALLASQMASTHALAMSMLGQTRRAELISQADVQGGLAIKLLRTFTLQADTLAKLKRVGGQTVRVEHVHVHSGGQAVVGTIATGGGAF